MEKKKAIKWYDDARTVSTLIISVILLIIICSQSFVVVGDSSIEIFSSVINHNSIYLLILFYFICLKTYYGKKNFNYINVFLVFVYFILSVTSFLTIIQSFSIVTILDFLVDFIVLIYLFHTMFRDTRIWKDFKLGNSPFNEITNDAYYSTIIILVGISLIINLISTVVLSGLFVSILDAIYVSLLARYIYLYRDYLDINKKDIDNSGNFDKIKSGLKNDLNEIKEKVSDVSDTIRVKSEDFIKDNRIDEKIDNIKEKGQEVIKEVEDDIKSAKSKIDAKDSSTGNKKKKTTRKSKKGDK